MGHWLFYYSDSKPGGRKQFAFLRPNNLSNNVAGFECTLKLDFCILLKICVTFNCYHFSLTFFYNF